MLRYSLMMKRKKLVFRMFMDFFFVLIVLCLYLIETRLFHFFLLFRTTTLWIPLHEFFIISFLLCILCILPFFKRIIFIRFWILDQSNILLIYFPSCSIWRQFKKWGGLFKNKIWTILFTTTKTCKYCFLL